MLTIYIVLTIVLAFAIPTAILMVLCDRAPIIEDKHETVIEERRRLLRYAAWLKDQQETTSLQFVDSHEPTTDYEIEELTTLIYDNPSPKEYEQVMQRIMWHRFANGSESCRNN